MHRAAPAARPQSRRLFLRSELREDVIHAAGGQAQRQIPGLRNFFGNFFVSQPRAASDFVSASAFLPGSPNCRPQLVGDVPGHTQRSRHSAHRIALRVEREGFLFHRPAVFHPHPTPSYSSSFASARIDSPRAS
jgi:hypothetical protein